MNLYSATTIAGHLVQIARDAGFNVDNLKLQKLLFYSQAWHLALYDGRPLFSDAIEAWVHGPVVPAVFKEYRNLRWANIPPPSVAPEPIDSHVRHHLKEIIGEFGHFSGRQLEQMTHCESPWITARGGLAPDEPSSEVITLESMTEYYRRLAE